MKKILLVLALALVVGLSASFSYAELLKVSDTEQKTNLGSRIDNKQREVWFQQRMEWKKAQLEKALTDGQITKEEFQVWNDHFKSMEEFHEKNGFMPGTCQGGYVWKDENGLKRGFGHGIMRGHRWNR
ncbi:MAG: hypothetical protein GX023_10930 [Tissierellia bacterium]|nr:hypothetical protein [Tissierellia bacterium]